MPITYSARPGVVETLQEASTTGSGSVLSIPRTITNHMFYIKANGAVGAGAVALETASDPEYTGTWALLVNELTTPTANPVIVVSSAELIYNYKGVLAAVRARVTTTVTTTSVTVKYLGNSNK